MIAWYLGLYEEGEVEHINGVRPSFLEIQLLVVTLQSCACYPRGRKMHAHMKAHLVVTPSAFESELKCYARGREGGTIDMLDFTFFI